MDQIAFDINYHTHENKGQYFLLFFIQVRSLSIYYDSER